MEKPLSSTAHPAWDPTRVVTLELCNRMPSLPAFDANTGQLRKRARVLACLHGQPLGRVDIELGENGRIAAECATLIWQELAALINEHLRQDGIPEVEALASDGLPLGDLPSCAQHTDISQQDAPLVSIVVPTRDRLSRLAYCLQSLLALDYPHYEILIVDNAPATQNTFMWMAEQMQFVPNLRYLREEHPGASWARNRGWTEAEGEIVAFTDDDVLVSPNWLKELVGTLNSVSGVACVTGMVMPAEIETLAQELFEQHGGLGKGLKPLFFGPGNRTSWNPLCPYTSWMFGSSNNMAIKKSIRDLVGEFDPALGPGTPALDGEDAELFYRIAIRDLAIVYQPRAIIYHFHRQDYEGLCKQIYSYGIGMSAHLTKSLLLNPRALTRFLARFPYALYYALSPHSPKNKLRQPGFPSELEALEWKGLLGGPFAYMKSRRHVRQLEKQFRD